MNYLKFLLIFSLEILTSCQILISGDTRINSQCFVIIPAEDVLKIFVAINLSDTARNSYCAVWKSYEIQFKCNQYIDKYKHRNHNKMATNKYNILVIVEGKDVHPA